MIGIVKKTHKTPSYSHKDYLQYGTAGIMKSIKFLLPFMVTLLRIEPFYIECIKILAKCCKYCHKGSRNRLKQPASQPLKLIQD